MNTRANVSALIDSTQAVVAAYTYDAFGNTLSKIGTLDQPCRFSTKEYNDRTGLSYYGYRFYSPALGRWLTRDPLGERGGINLYGFAQNDPVNRVDPYGLQNYGQMATGGLQFAHGFVNIGLGLAFIGAMSEAFGPPGTIIAVQIGAGFAMFGSFEIEHGLKNIKEGWSPEEPRGPCP